MNKNVLIVLAGGFVVAILVAVLVQASLGGKKVESTEVTTQVLVASQNLPLGKELADGDLKWQAWPGDQAFDGAIVRKQENDKASDALKGRLISPVSAGQPVLASYIFKEGKGNLVAATLDKGMRGVGIPVSPESMAGGFISPGDYVDVIMSYKVATNPQDTPGIQSLVSKAASETILSNVKVLAVDQEASREDEKAKIARTVTLQVDSKGAEKLALAADMGSLTLALRGIGDKAENKSNVTTDVQVSKVLQDVARLEGGGGSGTVRIYNGATVQEVRTRNGTTIMNSTETGTAGKGTAEVDPAEGDR